MVLKRKLFVAALRYDKAFGEAAGGGKPTCKVKVLAKCRGGVGVTVYHNTAAPFLYIGKDFGVGVGGGAVSTGDGSDVYFKRDAIGDKGVHRGKRRIVISFAKGEGNYATEF